MKAGGGLVFGVPRAAVLPKLFVNRRRSVTFRCYSSSSSSGMIPTSARLIPRAPLEITSVHADVGGLKKKEGGSGENLNKKTKEHLRALHPDDHVSFIKDIAVAQPPEHLHHLLKMLQVRGESIISPAAKQGMIPLAIPLSKNNSGSITALLRWPTAPPGMEMPVVEVRNYGVWLMAKNVDQYIHRILVEEDANGSTEGIDEMFNASGEAGEKLYTKGDFAKSRNSNLDVYLLQKVGLFPDILERKVGDHFNKGDHVSAMVTGEFYTKKEHFPGFGRPFVFNAEVLLRVGRKPEAKDAARGALKSPWWTLGCPYQEVAEIAEWDDEQIEFIKEKVSEEGKQEDLQKGKEAAQISLDEAAFLLDLASIEGTWDEELERIAECYNEGGLPEIAKFLKYRD